MLEHMKLCFRPHGIVIYVVSFQSYKTNVFPHKRFWNLFVPVGPIRNFGSSSANFLMNQKF